jgi:hypothetical protein
MRFERQNHQEWATKRENQQIATQFFSSLLGHLTKSSRGQFQNSMVLKRGHFQMVATVLVRLEVVCYLLTDSTIAHLTTACKLPSPISESAERVCSACRDHPSSRLAKAVMRRSEKLGRLPTQA